jgi:hypothetical protein
LFNQNIRLQPVSEKMSKTTLQKPAQPNKNQNQETIENNIQHPPQKYRQKTAEDRAQ